MTDINTAAQSVLKLADRWRALETVGLALRELGNLEQARQEAEAQAAEANEQAWQERQKFNDAVAGYRRMLEGYANREAAAREKAEAAETQLAETEARMTARIGELTAELERIQAALATAKDTAREQLSAFS